MGNFYTKRTIYTCKGRGVRYLAFLYIMSSLKKNKAINHSLGLSSRKRIGLIFALALWLCASYRSIAYSQQDAQLSDSRSFMENMVGEWIGTFDQSTNGVKASTKYFKAVARRTGPDSLKTEFKYYKFDPETQQPFDAGMSIMTSAIGPDGTVTNTFNGGGDVLIDVNTMKWERHQFSEILKMSSPSILEGSGTGTIRVSDAPSEKGKKGKIVKYVSTWSMNDGVLRIAQQFAVKFKVLFFGKVYEISMAHTVKRGNDILGLIRDAESQASSGKSGQ